MDLWAEIFGEKVGVRVKETKRGKWYWVGLDREGAVVAIQPMPFYATRDEAYERARWICRVDFAMRE